MKADHLFVSIVVPTFNRRVLLARCLEALGNLDYPDDMYEVIVVNDGSTDDTRDYLEAHDRDFGFKLIVVSQENLGISSARNNGIRHASGDIIAITDDDCIPEKDWLKLIAGGFTDYHVGGAGGTVQHDDPATMVQRYIEDTGLLSQEKFSSMNFLLAGSSAYRKKIMKGAGGYDEYLKSCEDVDMSIQAQLKGFKLRYIPEAVVHHEHPATWTHLFRQQYRNSIGFAQLHKKYVKDFNPGYNILILSYRILFKAVTIPFTILKAIIKGSGRYQIVKPALDMVILTSNISGIFVGTLFSRPYPGKPVEEKLGFIEDQSMTALARKVGKKLF
ncbi:glycosyltransferase [Candidatus Altiarchaeota archaeon]